MAWPNPLGTLHRLLQKATRRHAGWAAHAAAEFHTQGHTRPTQPDVVRLSIQLLVQVAVGHQVGTTCHAEGFALVVRHGAAVEGVVLPGGGRGVVEDATGCGQLSAGLLEKKLK